MCPTVLAAWPFLHPGIALATAVDLSWPVPTDAHITSPFGWRAHPVLKTRRFHEGVDIAVAEGTAVHAANGGRVTRAREDAVNGRQLQVGDRLEKAQGST